MTRKRYYMLMAVGAFIIIGMAYKQKSNMEPMSEKNKNAVNMIKNNKHVLEFLKNMNKNQKNDVKEMVNSLLE